MFISRATLVALVVGLLVLAGIPFAAASPTASPAPSVVWALAADPFSPNTLYAATDAGLFKSLDGGLSWSATTAPTPTVRVATDPSHAGTVYVGSDVGLSRSLDGGATWSSGAGFPAGSSIRCIAVDSARSIVFAGIDAFPASATLGLYASADQGATFRPTGLTGYSVMAIAIDPSNPQILYAIPFAERSTPGPGMARGIVKSTDGGLTWRTAFSPFGYVPPFGPIVIDPTNTAVLYVLYGPLLLKSTDGGASWIENPIFDPSAVHQGASDLVIDPASPTTLYLATGQGVFRTLDSGGTWSSLPSSPQSQVRTLLLDRSRLFIGLDVGLSAAGVRSPFYRSDDRGATWLAARLPPCVIGSQRLCFFDGRFDARVTWTAPSEPASPLAPQAATAIPLVAQTGGFWFFMPDNLDLVVKVLDGRSINGKFWVFYGSLTNVGFTMTVTDTVTGAVKTYVNSQGQLASVADVAAF